MATSLKLNLQYISIKSHFMTIFIRLFFHLVEASIMPIIKSLNQLIFFIRGRHLPVYSVRALWIVVSFSFGSVASLNNPPFRP